MKTKSEIMELVNAIPTCAFLYKFASPYGDGFVWRTDCSQWNGQKPIGWIELVDRAAIEAALPDSPDTSGNMPTVPDETTLEYWRKTADEVLMDGRNLQKVRQAAMLLQDAYLAFRAMLSAAPEPAQVSYQELPNNELPGMWDRSDFLGGETDCAEPVQAAQPRNEAKTK